ncbi:cytochrome c biogenesis CcdA family protein [Salsipaludibacter albus]|uniref:cytochrome c biogenesis CcdA family protein n=1 Tax=Salsipaludibacter albus TaxID=2849650 RepID=UPI001EE4CFFE|nr:cytochrome c biogenesis protein CcdA [Salsipaludibacter albus]
MTLVPLLAQGAAQTVQGLIGDANFVVAAAIAAAAGLVSFASPCVLPLVPGYLSFMTGLSGQDLAGGGVGRHSRVLLGSILFVAGFAVPFVLFGVAVGALDVFDQRWVKIAMGLFVAAMGVAMASGRLSREVRVSDRAPRGGLLTAPVLGFIFGVGWTPCIGPAAAAILNLAAVSSTGAALRGGALAFVYALGLGIPFILFGVFFSRAAGALDVLKRNARTLQIVGGVMLVIVGIALATGLWDTFILRLRPLINGFTPPI